MRGRIYADKVNTPDGPIERVRIVTESHDVQAVHPVGENFVSVQHNGDTPRMIPADGFLDRLFRMIPGFNDERS